jgi:hypothetical protein
VAERQLNDFNPQNLSMTVWALATLKYSDGSSFIQQFLKVVEPRLKDFKPQNLTNTIWALAKLNYFEGPFIKQFLRDAEPHIREFDPRNVSNLLWALATLKYADGSSFIKLLLTATEPILKDFRAQNLTNTIWALATLNYRDGSHFIKLLMKEIERKRDDFDRQNLANTAWALAVLDDSSSAPQFLASFLSLAYQMADEMKDQESYQCLQYLLLMEDRGRVNAKIKADPRYVNLRRICKSAECHERISRTQSGVLQLVRRLPGCSEAIYEHSTEDGLFTMDIALLLNGGQKLAIEVDGPSHFLSDWKSFSGNTALRNCLLENRGWKVVSVSASDWFTLSGNDERIAYLKAKLGHYLDIGK